MNKENNKNPQKKTFMGRLWHVVVLRWRWAAAMIGMVVVIIASVVITGHCGSMPRKRMDIVLEDTPIQIEEVRPRGEIYVFSSLVEDYAMERRTEMHLGILPEKHSCIQILRQKISYKINLDKVRYTLDTLNIIIVEMPPVEYTASTQSSPFISDDEDFWIKELPSTNELKAKVERKIRHRFDTEENRRKAERYAENALSELLGKLGYEARFRPRVERKNE
ncbi:MAG: DUF4230 domain-containing protein [Bacteroides sp.]|nr:DUF4230 domain-containing protein [Bacteroides sp.]